MSNSYSFPWAMRPKHQKNSIKISKHLQLSRNIHFSKFEECIKKTRQILSIMLLHKVVRSIICIPRLRILWTLETMLVKFAICLASDSTPSLDQTSSIHWAKDNWVQSETYGIYKIKVNQYSAAFGIFEFFWE
mgnify:CR=1 FL=1